MRRHHGHSREVVSGAMSPYLAMCLSEHFRAMAVAYLYCLGLYAESFTMLAIYLRNHNA